MTPEEFDAVSDWDEDCLFELVNGIVIVSPAPGPVERDPNDELGWMIRDYQYRHPQGGCVDKTLPEQQLKVGANRRRCDRAVWVGLGRPPKTAIERIEK